MIPGTQVECTEILRLPFPSFPTLFQRFLATANACGNESLNHERKRKLGIRRHALDHARELIDVVSRARDTLERMAVRAGSNRCLVLLRSSKAGQPFCIGDL